MRSWSSTSTWNAVEGGHVAKRSIVVAALGMVGVLSACGAPSNPPVSVVTKTEVVAAHSSSSSAPNSATASSTPGSAAGIAALKRGWDKLSPRLSQPVSVSIVAVGTSATPRIDLGTLPTQVAWSTIKVPLAIAAERKNGPQTSTAAAIQQSDNTSAEALWASLGSDQTAAAAVNAVLREGGSTADVPSTRLRAGFTIFGQTRWPVPDAATFSAHLPCMSGTKRVIGYMETVAGNQQWGAEIMTKPSATAVKGGWGPGPTSGYVVRQIGFITNRDGSMSAITMATLAPGSSLGSGTAVLNQVAKWLNANVKALPRGSCGR